MQNPSLEGRRSVSIRFGIVERQLIAAAAYAVGEKPASFVRSTALAVARATLEPSTPAREARHE
jgi:uncharacterized protein (DUF1778 family)